MLEIIKNIARQLVAVFPIPLTKNEAYDRLTNRILQQVASPTTTGIDIGCNKGKILQMMVHAFAPNKPIAFEPIPTLFTNLQQQFGEQAILHNIAASNTEGVANFSLVLSDMAYSGLQQRSITANMQQTTIEVTTNLLDNVIPAQPNIAVIKIDVEGAELLVLQGAVKTIQRHQPIVLFEFGKKGAEAYGYTETDIFNFFQSSVNYQIYTLQHWLYKKQPLTQFAFSQHYQNDTEYFFVAAPKQ